MTHKDRLEAVLISRALDIAAGIMVLDGYCLFTDKDKCRKKEKNRMICERCIRNFLVGKAKNELHIE